MSIILVQTLAMGLGDAEGLVTERIPKQEVRHPLSLWTNCVRISLVLFGLRMAHKMFYSQHPVLKKKKTHAPNPVTGKGHSVRFASYTLLIHPNKCLWLPVVYQALGHVQDKCDEDDKDTRASDPPTHLGCVVKLSSLELLVLQ